MTSYSFREIFKEHVIPEGDIQKIDTEELGRGAYGVDIKVKYKGNLVAARRLQSTLLETGNTGTEKFEERFKEECMRYAHAQNKGPGIGPQSLFVITEHDSVDASLNIVPCMKL